MPTYRLSANLPLLGAEAPQLGSACGNCKWCICDDAPRTGPGTWDIAMSTCAFCQKILAPYSRDVRVAVLQHG